MGQNKNLCPEETYILVEEERDIKQVSKTYISHNVRPYVKSKAEKENGIAGVEGTI